MKVLDAPETPALRLQDDIGLENEPALANLAKEWLRLEKAYRALAGVLDDAFDKLDLEAPRPDALTWRPGDWNPRDGLYCQRQWEQNQIADLRGRNKLSARAHEVLTAWDEWQVRKEEARKRLRIDELDDQVQALFDKKSSIIERVSRMRTTSIIGLTIKLTLLANMHTEDEFETDDDIVGEFSNETLMNSLIRDTLALQAALPAAA